MVYENCRIYGPYLQSDGRYFIQIIFPDGRRKSTAYARYLVEIDQNRYLEGSETVHHIDRNKTNDVLDNLKIIDRIKHVILDHKRIKDQIFICQVCKKHFILTGSQIGKLINNRKRKNNLLKRGPFCSRKCRGYASHYPDKYETLRVEAEYFYLENN